MNIDFNKKDFKILLFTGFAGWTQVLHNLAIRIKKDYTNVRFTAYCLGVHNKKYLNEQTDINYDDIFCSDEMRLNYWNNSYDEKMIESLEKKYGDPFLTKLFYSDRRLVTHSHPDYYDHDPSHKEILNIFQATFIDFEKILNECDLSIAYCAASSEAQVLYRICKINEIPFLTFIHGRIGQFVNFQKTAADKHTILENEWEKAIINERFSSKEAISWYEECYNKLSMESKTTVPYVSGVNYTVDNKRITLRNIIKSLNNLVKKRAVQNDTVSRSVQLKKNILFKIRQHKSRKYYSKIFPKAPFVIFPMHLDPEASTLGVGGKNYDVLGVIKRIVYFLPSRWKLVVKEHGAMRGRRPISVYEELRKIYNVEIISPDVNGIALMKKSEAVIVNTSTMGLEAAIIGLRVICLGSPYYSFIPSIFTPKSFDEIESILNNEWNEEKKNKCKLEMKNLIETLFDISLKDYDRILWDSKPDIDKNDRYLDNLYKQLHIDMKLLYK